MGSRLLLLSVIASAALTHGADDPRKVAEALVDEMRDDAHRQRIRIVWPETVPELPAHAEAYLIEGYINYRTSRIVWKDSKLQAFAVNMKRTWFYNTKGESFTSEVFDLDPAAFKAAWQAAMLISGMRAEEIKTDNDDELHGGSVHSSMSSHASYHWIRLSSGEALIHQGVTRGWRSRNGILDFEQIRNRALDRLISALFEKSQGKAAPLADWAPFLAEQLAAAARKPVAQPETVERLPLETSLRLIGEIGHQPAAESIAAIEASLAGEDYFVKSLRQEAQHAQVKIRFRNNWDAEKAHREIVNNPRAQHAQNDVSRWLRRQYFERDPDGYRARLIEDLKEYFYDSALLSEAIGELAARYPGQAREQLAAMLAHGEPQVAADAAFALHKTDAEHAKALETLKTLASDVTVAIPPGAHWFAEFGRARAVRYFLSEDTPAAWRWDTARVLAQITTPGEDGRIIHQLLQHLKHAQWDDKNVALAAWRQVLKGKVNRGALLACEQLLELNDEQSAPQISKLLDELNSGRNARFSWEKDSRAKYPWTDKYELEKLQKRVDALQLQGNPAPENF